MKARFLSALALLVAAASLAQPVTPINPYSFNFFTNANQLTANTFLGTWTNLNVFNVKVYGAKGNGVTDDAPAMRAAVAAAKAAGGGTVYIPPGAYVLSSVCGTKVFFGSGDAAIELPSNVTLCGAGSGTIITMSPSQLNPVCAFISTAGATNVEVCHFTLNQNKDNRGMATSPYVSEVGILFQSGYNCYAHDIYILNSPNEGIDLEYGTNMVAERVCITNNSGSGFSCAGFNQTVRDCRVYACGFNEGNYTSDANNQRHWGAAVTCSANAYHVTIDNLYAVSNYCGVQSFQSQRLTIQNSYIEGWGTNYCVYIGQPVGAGVAASGEWKLSNNTFKKNNISSVGYANGLWISDTTTGGTIGQNSFNYCAVMLSNTPNVTVAGNTFSMPNAAGATKNLTIKGTTSLVTVSGNHFNDGGDICLDVWSAYNQISGNWFNGYAAIAIEGISNNITGNYVQTATASYSIYLDGPTNYWIGNHFGQKPLRFTANQGPRPDGNWFIGNYCDASPTRDGGANPAGNVWRGNNMPFDGYASDSYQGYPVGTARITETDPNNQNGGDPANTTAYFQRVLNTIEGGGSWVSLNANTFTLTPGIYTIEARVPGYTVNRFTTRLWNDTAGSKTAQGSSQYNNGSGTSYSLITARVSLTANTTFEIQQRCAGTSGSGWGLGVACNFGDNEIYTEVLITKYQ